MKTKAQKKNFLPIAIIIVLMAVSVYMAAIVYDFYQPVAKGSVGGALVIFVYRIYVRSEKIVRTPIHLLFEYPTGLKFIGFAVFWPMIIYWSCQFFIDMILYLMNLF